MLPYVCANLFFFYLPLVTIYINIQFIKFAFINQNSLAYDRFTTLILQLNILILGFFVVYNLNYVVISHVKSVCVCTYMPVFVCVLHNMSTMFQLMSSSSANVDLAKPNGYKLYRILQMCL